MLDAYSQVIEAAYLHRRAAHRVLSQSGAYEAYGAALIFRFSVAHPSVHELHPATPVADEPDWTALMANIAPAYYLGLGVLAVDHLCLTDKWGFNHAFNGNTAETFKAAANKAVHELMKTPLKPDAIESQKVRTAKRQMATVVEALHRSVSRRQCMAMGLAVPVPAFKIVLQSAAKPTPQVSPR